MVYSSFLEFCIQVSLAVLLPIAPAYLLYKTLPSRATVSGPFRGLNIQLTGAFGGYFLVLLVVVGMILARQEPVRHEVWTVTGKVTLKNGDPSHRAQINHSDITVVPPTTLLYTDGRFDLEVLVKPGQGGSLEFPIIAINHSGYAPVTIPLGDRQPTFGAKPFKLQSDGKTKKRFIETPIELEPLTAGGNS